MTLLVRNGRNPLLNMHKNNGYKNYENDKDNKNI